MTRTGIAAFITAFFILSQASHASQGNDGELKGGFSGSVTIGGGYISGTSSNHEITDDNDMINSYSEGGDKLATAIPVLDGSLSYTFKDTGTILFLGSSPGVGGLSAGAFSGGITQMLGEVGSVTLAGGLRAEEVWKDPYLLGVKREETDLHGYTVALSLDLFGASASYGFARQNVKDDLIGIREPNLDRDGEVHNISLGYSFAINDGNIIIPSVQYMKAAIVGKSNSFDGYGGSLTHMFTSGRHTLITSVAYAQRKFDRTHPVFNKVRNEKDLGGNLTYLREALFGHESLTYVVMFGYSQTHANISFFENDLILGGMGVQYEF